MNEWMKNIVINKNTQIPYHGHDSLCQNIIIKFQNVS